MSLADANDIERRVKDLRVEHRIVVHARSLISRKYEDLPFVIGPDMLPPKYLIWLGVRLFANGLCEFRLSSLKLPNTCPRNLSEPGLVRSRYVRSRCGRIPPKTDSG